MRIIKYLIVSLFCLANIGSAFAASTTPISGLPSGGAVRNGDLVPIVRSGTTYGGTITSSGNSTVLATTTGALTPGDCAEIDSNGNFIDSGISGCGGSAGVSSFNSRSGAVNLQASDVGTVSSINPVAHQFLTGFSGYGIFSQAQPAFSDISGSLNLATQVTGLTSVANGGTGTSSPSLVAGSNITITGSWPNQTIAASGSGGGSVVASPQYQIPFYSASGTSSTLTGSSSIKTNSSGNLFAGLASGSQSQTTYNICYDSSNNAITYVNSTQTCSQGNQTQGTGTGVIIDNLLENNTVAPLKESWGSSHVYTYWGLSRAFNSSIPAASGYPATTAFMMGTNNGVVGDMVTLLVQANNQPSLVSPTSWAANFVVNLDDTSTNPPKGVGLEIDMQPNGATSSTDSHGLLVNAFNGGTINGAAIDVGGMSSPLTSFNGGIFFDNYSLTSGSTIIGTAGGHVNVADGIDFSGATFSDCVFKTAGGCNITAGGSEIKATSSTATAYLDAIASGSGHQAAMRVYDTNSGHVGFLFDSANNVAQFNVIDNTGSTTANSMSFLSNGNVGIGTSSPSTLLEVNGNAKIDGSITVTSCTGCGGGGSGTVNSASQYALGVYPSTGTTIGGSSTITSDSSGNLNVSGGNVDVTNSSSTAYIIAEGEGSGHAGALQVWDNNSGHIGEIMYSNNGYSTLASMNSSGVVGNTNLQLYANGQVYIGAFASSSSTTVCQNGNILSSCSSARRFKKDIQPFNHGLDYIMALNPVEFNWKDHKDNPSEQHDLGFIAEDVEGVDKILATYDKDGLIQGVKYAQLTTILVNAIKEQQKEIEENKGGCGSFNKLGKLLFCK